MCFIFYPFPREVLEWRAKLVAVVLLEGPVGKHYCCHIVIFPALQVLTGKRSCL